MVPLMCLHKADQCGDDCALFAILRSEASAYCRTVAYRNARGDIVSVDKRHCCAVMQTYGYKLSAERASRIATASASTGPNVIITPSGTSRMF